MFRTVSAQWFEELIAKPTLARSVEVLAETGAVEFEFVDRDDPALELSELRVQLEPYHRIARKLSVYLPAPIAPRAVAAERLEKAIERNLGPLIGWEESARPLVEELERLFRDISQMEELLEFLSLVDHTRLDMGQLHDAAPALKTCLFILPPDTATPEVAEHILHLRLENDHAVYLLTLGADEETDEARRVLSGLDGRSLWLPEWLRGSVPEAMDETRGRLDELKGKVEARQQRMSEINREYDTGKVLGELRRLDWLVEHLEGVPVGEYFAHLTGWTSDLDGHTLRLALEKANLPTVLFLTVPPASKKPPTLIRNPVWIRPFEFFGRLMGTPGSSEAEPSPLIAIIAPLMFGYMFGDVGHGLVILGLGLLLRKRWPAMAMLISGGIVSIIFGFLYGSIFTFEHLIPALWLVPFEEPLTLLFVPMIAGACLILLGMSLNGLGHWWEGRFNYWLRCEAGMMVAYVAAILTIIDMTYLAGVLVGIVWHVAGNVWVSREDGLAALGTGIGDLFEYTLQLAVNTVSFVRVGAFALAHAGLGATVFSLADSTEHMVTAAIILLVGNTAIIALEGLVVSVQTTRLLLFEFFIRFMKAGGRPFQPMVPPDYEVIHGTGKEE